MRPCILNQCIPCTLFNKQGKSNGFLELNMSTNTRSSALSRKWMMMIQMLCDSNRCWSLFRATCCADIGRDALDMKTTFLCSECTMKPFGWQCHDSFLVAQTCLPHYVAFKATTREHFIAMTVCM